MDRILSRSSAFLLATMLVGVSGWVLSRPYLNDLAGRSGPLCMCLLPLFDDISDWQRLDAGSFALMAPPGTVLRRDDDRHGAVIDRRFVLTFALEEAAGRDGSVSYEAPMSVGGRSGVMRWKDYPGKAASIFVQLVVPHAVERNGRWRTLEIHGFAQTGERALLAERVMRTVDFTPPFDVPMTPSRLRVAAPVIAIVPGSAP